MKATIVLVVYLLCLIGCNDKTTTTHYVCNDNKAVLNILANEKAELTFKNKTYHLTHAKSASGNKYISNKVLFWGKGTEAMLIISGNKHLCSTK